MADASDYHSPRTAALGGSGHAAPLLNDAIYLNPAYTSFLPAYSWSASYERFRGPATEPDGSSFFRGHGWNASLQDGRSELFQAGVGFTQREDARWLHVGASKSVVKRLGVGIGTKMVFPADPTQARITDMTASVSGFPLDWFQAVLVVDNLLQGAAARDRGLYREFVLGTKTNIMGIAMLYFDPHLTPDVPEGVSTYGFQAGLELTLMSDVFLRLGAFRNSQIPFLQKRGNGYATGIGWLGPRMSLDYSIERPLEPVASTAHQLGMTLYF